MEIRKELVKEGVKIETKTEGLIEGRIKKRGKMEDSEGDKYVGKGEMRKMLKELEEWDKI